MITDCLSAAGIRSVVWIDDHFGNPTRDDLAAAIRARLRALRKAGKSTPTVGVFAAINLRESDVEIEDAADDVIESLSDSELATAERTLAEADRSFELHTALQPDLTSEQFADLEKAFGAGLRTFGSREWTSVGMGEFRAASDETLFLIDREFTREGGGISGDDLLKDVAQTTDAFCIMLTHTCNEGQEDQRRLELADSKKLDAFRFSVVSKQQSGDPENIDWRFSRAIYAVMTHRFTGEIAHGISDAIQITAKSTEVELARQSVFDLDQALFANSNREGAPEFDVVLRVFRIQQRQAMSATLRAPTLQKRLRSARRFRQATVELRRQWPQSVADMSAFREWRRHEVLEDGSPLNELHVPLACGDVFESLEEPVRRYIFLAQPCDLMVREDGERRNEIGLLARVLEADVMAAASASGGRFYDIKGVFGADKMWRVDFQKITIADTSVMDLAVFNADGVLRLTRDHPQPLIALPAGWQLRFEKIKRRIFAKAGQPNSLPFGMGSNIHSLKPKSEADLITYPLRRAGRLDTSIATAILAAWASFQTRAALEHDFAKPPPTIADIRTRAYFISEAKRNAGVLLDPVADWYPSRARTQYIGRLLFARHLKGAARSRRPSSRKSEIGRSEGKRALSLFSPAGRGAKKGGMRNVECGMWNRRLRRQKLCSILRR